jgi:hypothetical protein
MRKLLAIACLFITACQTSHVAVDYDTATNFSNVQFYEWLDATSGTEEGFEPLIAERTKAAVANALGKTALLPASDHNKADILVRYYVASYTQSQPSQSSGSLGFGGGSHGSAMGISLSFPLGGDRITKEAQIIVDLISTKDNKLKWRGSNRLQISDETPAQITALIEAAVAEIFSFYPPGKTGN